MSAHTYGGAPADMEIPSMLDLVHLSRRPLFPPGGIDICRQIALLTGMKEGDEVLVVPSGLAVTLEHFVREYDVVGSGVEDDLPFWTAPRTGCGRMGCSNGCTSSQERWTGCPSGTVSSTS